MRRIALLLALLLAAAAPARAQGDLRIALQDDPDSLDPAINWTFVGRHVLQSLCDKLVDLDEQGEIVPMLAKSWAWDEDGRALTFRLRDGVVFHDGTPFNAEAVRFNLDRSLTLRASRRRAEIEAIERIEVADPMTVRLVLKQPSVPLLAALSDRAGMMVSPAAVAAAGEGFSRAPVCAGPYRFVEHRPQDRLVLERFPAHWRAADYHFDRLVFRPMPDSTVRLLNLRSGAVDLIERLGPNDLAQVRTERALAVNEVTGLGYYALTFNVGGTSANPVLAKSAAARQAIGLAIDREAVNQVAFAGAYQPGNQPFAPDSPWYDKARPVPGRDVAAAKAKLAEAGVKELAFELLVPTDPERMQVAQVVQSMLAEVGIALRIQSVELVSLLDRARRGEFQAHLIGWSGRSDPDLNISPMLACGASGNDGKYCSEALEAALAAGRANADPAARRAAYTRAVGVLLDEAPIAYLYHAKWIFAHRAGLQGLRAVPDGIVRVDGVKLAR